jgi:predicted oxidoreductase
MPSPARSSARFVGGHASQIRIAIPALKDGGEGLNVAGLVERRRCSKIRSETSLRRRSREENGRSSREVREDLVPEAQTMIENSSVLGGDAEIVPLCQFDHPVRRFGIVKDDLQ